MDAEKTLSIREKAAIAWKRERPLREAARIEQQARQMEAVDKKLTQMFGPECEIKLGLSPAGTIIAEVENVRFTTDFYEDDFFCSLAIILKEICPYCGRDMILGRVDNLADLGKRLEEFESGISHSCLRPNE
jgi:hypothetical protein